MWTRGVLQGYMAITAHYMGYNDDGHLVLKSRLVAFRYVPGSHDGEHMASVFLDVLKELDVVDRVRCAGDACSPSDALLRRFRQSHLTTRVTTTQ